MLYERFNAATSGGVSLIEEKAICRLKTWMGCCSSLNGLDLATDEIKRQINQT
ncbi:hypothetical protein [Shewanella sediminis]|uniref:hypothetical protein n=1 Tax=Shewanella sediminis TaxID=271097 RepID=UPI00030E90DE|nr:hypothetical protein [Shewanella sediminis]